MNEEPKCPVCGVDEKYATDGSCAKCHPSSRRRSATSQGAPEAGAKLREHAIRAMYHFADTAQREKSVHFRSLQYEAAEQGALDAISAMEKALATSPSPPHGVGEQSEMRRMRERITHLEADNAKLYERLQKARSRGPLIGSDAPPVGVEVVKPLRTALVAMTLAKAMPGVADEYDFEPAIADVTKALSDLGAAP